MGFLKDLFGGARGTDAMRLDILMEYWVGPGFGSADLRWHDPHGGGEAVKAHLVALLYGRILCVHKETRSELFARVDALAKDNVRSEGGAGFEFAPWVLHVGLGGGDHRLWPWTISSPMMTEPKVYAAVLKAGKPFRLAPNGRWIHLSMAGGLTRVLAPSSALIAIAVFSRQCQRETRYLLALLLWQMNVFWGSPDRISFGTEALAYAAADKALHSGQLRLP